MEINDWCVSNELPSGVQWSILIEYVHNICDKDKAGIPTFSNSSKVGNAHLALLLQSLAWNSKSKISDRKRKARWGIPTPLQASIIHHAEAPPGCVLISETLAGSACNEHQTRSTPAPGERVKSCALIDLSLNIWRLYRYTAFSRDIHDLFLFEINYISLPLRWANQGLSSHYNGLAISLHIFFNCLPNQSMLPSLLFLVP